MYLYFKGLQTLSEKRKYKPLHLPYIYQLYRLLIPVYANIGTIYFLAFALL